ARKSAQQAGRLEIGVAGVASAAMIVLAIIVLALAPPADAQAEVQVANTIPEKMTLGQDLYSVNCVECHGPDGEGGIIQGVEGLEGVNLKAIHSQDEMYTRDDQSLADIIAYGQPNLGMQPFGSAYGGTLSPTDIEYIVTFMRYTWDDRAELPAGTSPVASIPVLNSGEVPSFDVHIGPLVKRYCISCHRAGKQNNNYLLTSYDEMLNTGDNAPVIVAGDPESLLIQLISGHEGIDPKTGNTIRQMPPAKLLDQQYIDMLTNWILAGMPQMAEDAAKASP
ncbi:MAG: c-type cytochrome, partial [Chloroflexota bacterium]